MDRRAQLNKENRKRMKNLLKKEDKKAYKILVFSMIAGIINYIVWHDQFVNLDLKYNVVFIVLPILIGMYFYWATNKNFIKDLFATKASAWWDRLGSNIFLVVLAVMFGYFTIGTTADVLFKLSMDFYTKDKPFVYKTYTVTSTSKDNTGKGMHLFSHIRYLDEDNKKHSFDVPLNSVETSNERRRITFKCQQGFWNYYKIIDYNLNDF